jgi:formamidopyrimidine-DNA glycosylase
LKRALTDPSTFSGIGNAYSDEILWEAQLSPVKRTSQLTDDEVARLHRSVVGSLEEWTRRLRDEVGEGWPDKVTAFRDDMAVHGKFGEPCPRCGSKVQRIVYSSNETNYCATCQTGGKLLADRSLSRLLKEDWPKTLEELEG